MAGRGSQRKKPGLASDFSRRGLLRATGMPKRKNEREKVTHGTQPALNARVATQSFICLLVHRKNTLAPPSGRIEKMLTFAANPIVNFMRAVEFCGRAHAFSMPTFFA